MVKERDVVVTIVDVKVRGTFLADEMEMDGMTVMVGEG